MNKRIQALREHLHMSQDAFGASLGVTRSSVCSWESGRRNISESIIKSICREFNVDYLWLTTGQGEMFIQSDDDVYSSIDKIMAGENELHRNLIKWMASLDEKDIDDIDRLISKYSNITKNE